MRPLLSGLPLTPGEDQDGILSVIEIFRLRFPGRAVVLSRCDPLPEKDPEGEEFFRSAAGVSSCGKPLRCLDPLAGRRPGGGFYLLGLFYRQLERNKSLADSLRTAQLRLIREGYPSYIWAAFILTGGY